MNQGVRRGFGLPVASKVASLLAPRRVRDDDRTAVATHVPTPRSAHGTRTEPLARGAVAACNRAAAIDEAVSRLAKVNDDWDRERQMLEEGLNLPAGLVKWIQYGYLLRDVRLEERAER